MDSEGGIPAEAVAEKMLPQSKVNELIGRNKAEVEERVARELEAKYQAELASLKAAQGNGGNEFDTGSMKEQIKQELIEEAQRRQAEMQRQQQEAELKAVAENYIAKMQTGSEMFDDFDEVMTDFDPSAFPQLIVLASKMDNLPAVMYELSKNPSKLMTLHGLSQVNPAKAQRELDKLAQSIAANEEAKANNVQTPPPLSKLKASTAGSDSGIKTLRDLKRDPNLRG